ncbi:MAG TPA: hypothetical protein VGU22_12160 [Methylomirabilota bacterium]|jgi:hypothetical protein|nr:hypothetical protein [Methylomirabilota bacterium]
MSARRGVALLLVVVTLLVTGVAAAHAHDSAEPGLYNTQCPLQELAGHATALLLAPPSLAALDVVAAAVPAFVDVTPSGIVSLAVAPRAPPTR